MSKLDIVTEPDPILHQKTKKIKTFDAKLKNLAMDMAETLFDNNGIIGLAAPQVGKLVKMIAIEYDPKRILDEEELKDSKEKAIPLVILVNPKITWKSQEKAEDIEGCLSLPDIELSVERSKEVHVLAEDIEGKKLKIRANGLFARILQHEIDHLDGILITDRAIIKPLKIVFMGTPDFSETILKRLVRSPYKPYLVITETDKPGGRGNTLISQPVKLLALNEGIEIWQPNRLSSIEEDLKQLNPDLCIVAAYGKIIPKSILDIPKYGSINVHPSLLPKYRGASPIQAAILNNDKYTGVTIMKMDEKMDHGPILSQAELLIHPRPTTEVLSKNLAKIGANLLVKTIYFYITKKIKPHAQKHDKATFVKLIKKEDGLINWNKSALEIDAKIRAYNPWPGAFTFVNGKRLKISLAHLENNKLIIDKVQMEGKNEISFADFLRGYHKKLDFLEKIK